MQLHPRELLGDDYDGDDDQWLYELLEASDYRALMESKGKPVRGRGRWFIGK